MSEIETKRKNRSISRPEPVSFRDVNQMLIKLIRNLTIQIKIIKIIKLLITINLITRIIKLITQIKIVNKIQIDIQTSTFC